LLAWSFRLNDKSLELVIGLFEFVILLFSLTAEPEFIKKGEKLQVMNFGDKARSAAPLEILLFVKN